MRLFLVQHQQRHGQKGEPGIKTKTTQWFQQCFFFSEIGCFEGTFRLQVKKGRWPYTAPQEPLKEKLDWLQKQHIIGWQSMYESVEGCNNCLSCKSICAVQLCLDPARLNKVLIASVHRGPTLNDLLLRLTGVKCLVVINVNSGYHNLKLDNHI